MKNKLKQIIREEIRRLVENKNDISFKTTNDKLIRLALPNNLSIDDVNVRISGENGFVFMKNTDRNKPHIYTVGAFYPSEPIEPNKKNQMQGIKYVEIMNKFIQLIKDTKVSKRNMFSVISQELYRTYRKDWIDLKDYLDIV
jgi:hypothetical protein